MTVRRGLAGAAMAAVLLATAGCGTTWESGAGGTAGGLGIDSPTASPSVTSPTPSTSPSTSPSPSTTPSPSDPPPSTPPPTPSPKVTPSPEPTPKPTPPSAESPVPAPAGPRAMLRPGDRGDDVLAMQKRLADLGYWLGTPDGTWGSLTTQAVYAVQKAAGIGRDGVAGAATQKALADGIRPKSRTGGTGVEIDLERQLLLIVRDGAVTHILNTSTGSNVPYTEVYEGKTYSGSARTPKGSFTVFRDVDKLDVGPLGSLWRPKYFNGGIAVHGAASIPPYPASHGCARLSNAAMNMIWAKGYMPIGAKVTVY